MQKVKCSCPITVEKPTAKKLEELNVKSWPIWEKEASKFDWYYDEPETCYFLKGKVTVKTKDGDVSFGQGDLVTFSKGLKCEWLIHEAVCKHYQFG